jgi:iron(III) transport system permease protein
MAPVAKVLRPAKTGRHDPQRGSKVALLFPPTAGFLLSCGSRQREKPGGLFNPGNDEISKGDHLESNKLVFPGRKFLSPIFSFLKPETPLYAVGLLAAAVICTLVLVVFWSTFQEDLPSFQTLFTFSLKNYSDVFSYPLMPMAALNTLLLAVGTTAVSLFVAILIAWLVYRTNVPFKKLFITLMLVHSVLPGFVRIMGWVMLISPNIGLINQMIRLVIPMETGPLSPYNMSFMIFLQGVSLVPTLFLMLGGAFMAIDPSFEEAAEASGLNRAQVFRRISLPLLRPAIVSGAIFIFVIAASMFEVPALLGSPYNIHFFSTLMFDAVQPTVGFPQFGVAGVYGVMQFVPTLVALHYYQRMIKLSHLYRTVTGKGYRPKFTNLGSWRWAGLTIIILYFMTDLVLPYLAVVWTSLMPSLQIPSVAALEKISLAGYSNAITLLKSQGAIGNTLQLLLGVGSLSMLIGLIMSWITLRTRMPGRYFIDTIGMLPQVVPGIAIAFAVAFLGLLFIKVMPLYGSVASIIIAGTIMRIPFTTRTISSSLIQIHPELEEAVQTSGASKLVALRKIIMPLITPALLYSFVWALLQAYRDVTTPLFLQSPKNMVLSTVIWAQWYGSNNYNVAAAISVLMVGVMAIFILILQNAFPQIRKGTQLN